MKKIAIVLHDYSLCHRFAPLGRKLVKAGCEIRTFCAKRPAPKEKLLDGFHPWVADWTCFQMGYIHEYRPDVVLLWNGRFPHMNAATMYLKKTYPTLIMEQGWLPQRGYSYLSPDLAQTCFPKVTYEDNVAGKYQHELDLIRESYEIKAQPGVDPYVFVPLQLEHDTQIRDTSGMFKTMNSLLGWAILAFPDIAVLYKEHPLQPGAEAIERPPGTIRYTGPLRSIDLAAGAKVVVGINSTVLAEANLFNVPIIGFGQHVCENAFLNAVAPRAIFDAHRSGKGLDIVSKIREEQPYLREMQDYYSVLLMLNQFITAEPPRWVIDLVMNYNRNVCVRGVR